MFHYDLSLWGLWGPSHLYVSLTLTSITVPTGSQKQNPSLGSNPVLPAVPSFREISTPQKSETTFSEMSVNNPLKYSLGLVREGRRHDPHWTEMESEARGN